MNTTRKNLLSQFGFRELNDLCPYIELIKSKRHVSIPQVMREKRANKQLCLQARYGFGEHQKMLTETQKIKSKQCLDVYTITIDSFTRNLMFDKLRNLSSFTGLNGYPSVSHGVKKTSEIVDACNGTIEIRHGSPDPRILAEVALAAGATGFEGGPISYTLPYSKLFRLEDAFDCWSYTNDLIGYYGQQGIEIERETFGTLSAVLIPPSIATVINLIEVLHMAESGIKNINISFNQSGNVAQDAATKIVLQRWLEILKPSFKQKIDFYFTFHMWMAPFPKFENEAMELIQHGLSIAKCMGMDRIILKTKAEAYRIPTIEDNIDALQFSKDFLKTNAKSSLSPSDEIQEEIFWLDREVTEIMEYFMNRKGSLKEKTCSMFQNGTLDIPFCPSIHTRGAVIGLRDATNAIRFYAAGNLPFSDSVKRFHQYKLQNKIKASNRDWLELIEKDIYSWRPNT